MLYIPDVAKKNWFVLLPEKRIIVVENVVEEEEYN
jgi:hypothetical protein